MWTMKRLPFVVILIALIFPTMAAGNGGVSKTWQRAEIWVRTADGFINSHMTDDVLLARLNKDARAYPTVVFFHDCGRNRKQAGWHYARFLARAGFAVILPDSFARPDRPEACEYWQLKPLANAPTKKVHGLRMAEIAHALGKAKALSWVDTDNLFVMGHGEGGDALAAFDGGGFKARVISAALCKWGLKGPTDIPDLLVASRDDRLFHGMDADTCGQKATGRSFKTVLFDGYQHDTSSLSDARDTVIDFLKTLVK